MASSAVDLASTTLLQTVDGSALGRITASNRLTIENGSTDMRGFRRLGAFALVLLLDGEGRYVDETGHDILLRAGSVIVTTPSIGHRYGPLPKGRWVERYVVFDGPMFTTWEMLGLFHTASPVIHTDDVETWNRTLDTIADSLTTSYTASMLERICKLQLMLAQLLWPSARPTPEESEHTTWIAAACTLLDAFDDYIGPRYDTSEIAKKLSMSTDGFRKRFKRLTGTPPERYRSRRRIEWSQSLIQQHPDITNRELADRLGYCDEHHFSRVFKQITGASPLVFRRTLPTPSVMPVNYD